VPSTSESDSTSPIQLGLRENWQQFLLLVIINAFVGGMVGLERTVVPLLAEEEFGQASATVALSFIIAFGIVKALANLFAGRLSDRIGRKGVLIAGWIFALPVPFMVIFAPTWEWIIAANILLGINQGLAWSTTVIMKIDLVGPLRRGLAMGLNEAAGYLAVSGAALASGYLAATYALRPAPFLLGIVFSVAGLLLTVLLVRESSGHARHEARVHAHDAHDAGAPAFAKVFRITSWGDRALFSVSQAGMINNLNDGLAWGLFPLYFASEGASLREIGWLAAIYPGVWGLGQLMTGALSDRTGRKLLITGGMWIQGLGIVVVLVGNTFAWWATGAVLLGIGTAMVYPTLLAAIGDVAHPEWRASSVGVYRLWRDMGYAVGALLAGILADLLNLGWAIGVVAGLTFISGVVVAMTMYETLGARPISLESTGPNKDKQEKSA
jgi:MFS family permease